jgi:hypothetical protein
VSPADAPTLTIFEKSKEGRRAFTPPKLDVPEVPVDDLLPASARRSTTTSPA